MYKELQLDMKRNDLIKNVKRTWTDIYILKENVK